MSNQAEKTVSQLRAEAADKARAKLKSKTKPADKASKAD